VKLSKTIAKENIDPLVRQKKHTRTKSAVAAKGQRIPTADAILDNRNRMLELRDLKKEANLAKSRDFLMRLSCKIDCLQSDLKQRSRATGRFLQESPGKIEGDISSESCLLLDQFIDTTKRQPLRNGQLPLINCTDLG
jgi:hypothetical protein